MKKLTELILIKKRNNIQEKPTYFKNKLQPMGVYYGC